MKKGTVTLVGAGPGHPDYLTLKGLRALESADVIVYDALIDASFKFLFPKSAKLFFVGKRCDRHYRTQKQINQLLVAQASQGKHVVRLKGGDPFLYGRGGEEWFALTLAGIPVEVVPGVSTLNAAGGLTGIPLTHRGVANKVMFLECHTQSLPEHDWQHIAAFDGTLVLFMAKQTIRDVAGILLAYGAAGSQSVALIENASLPDQVLTFSTLKALAEQIETPWKTSGPGLVYIGKVVDLLPTQNLSALRMTGVESDCLALRKRKGA